MVFLVGIHVLYFSLIHHEIRHGTPESIVAIFGRIEHRPVLVARDSLADLATDELIEMTGIDAVRATALITVARAHWFAEEE